MIRTIATAACLLLVTTTVGADPERDPRVEDVLNELPTRAEMKDALAQLPEINSLVTGMKDIAEDPETMETLERVSGRLEQHLSQLEFTDLEAGELPDLNVLMDGMLDLASDRETMGDLLGLMFQVVDLVEESVQDIQR